MNKLEALTAALDAATPGEWKVIKAGDDECGQIHVFDFVQVAEMRYIDCEGRDLQEASDNSRFVVMAHNMMPMLLDAVDALRECQMALDTTNKFNIPALGKDVTSYDLANKLDEVLRNLT